MTKMRRERLLKAKTTTATLPQDNRRSVDETNLTSSTVISLDLTDFVPWNETLA